MLVPESENLCSSLASSIEIFWAIPGAPGLVPSEIDAHNVTLGYGFVSDVF